MVLRVKCGYGNIPAFMTDEHFRKLERMYGLAPCNQGLDLGVTIEEGKATIHLPIRRNLFHAANAVHGAYYFKLLDDAAFFAVNSTVEDVFVLTVSFNTQLLRPVSSGELHSTGTLVRTSKTLFFADAVVTSDNGKEIARGTGVFSRSKMPLSEEIGYR